MAVDQATITVDNTKTWLLSEAEAGSYKDGTSICVTNISTTVDVWVGNSSVTTSNGTPVRSNDGQLAIDLGPGEDLYAVTASGSAECRVLRNGI